MRDLVAEQGGELVVVEPQLDHAAGEEDLAAGQRERVGLAHLDEEERERKILVPGRRCHAVADVGDAAQGGGVVPGAVLVDRLLRGGDALGEELGVGDLLRRAGGGEERGDEGAGGGARAMCARKPTEAAVRDMNPA